MNNCCCGECQTIYRLKGDGSVAWKADFFFDSPPDLYTGFEVNQCDVDADGNVYQAGSPTQALAGLASQEQSAPMYTLRSWDPSGNLRWSWSENPYGTISGDLRINPPAVLFGCRCGMNGEDPIVIVADGNAPTNVRALDASDASELWHVQLPIGSFVPSIVGVGATRSLWWQHLTNYLPFPGYGAWFTLDNATGEMVALTFASNGNYNYQSGLPTLCAAIDTDDTVYAVLANAFQLTNTNWGLTLTPQTLPYIFSVSKFPKDSIYPSANVTSNNFYFYDDYFSGGDCLKHLGAPNAIWLTEDNIYVASSQGIEVFDKASLTSIGYYCLSVGHLWYVNGISIALNDVVGSLSPPALHNLDTTPWLVWNSTSRQEILNTSNPVIDSTFQDARPFPAGLKDPSGASLDDASLWSQIRACSNHSPIDDERDLTAPCAAVCSTNCFDVTIPYSGGTGPNTNPWPWSGAPSTGDTFTNPTTVHLEPTQDDCLWRQCIYSGSNGALSASLILAADGVSATLTLQFYEVVGVAFYGYCTNGGGTGYYDLTGVAQKAYEIGWSVTLICDTFDPDGSNEFTAISGWINDIKQEWVNYLYYCERDGSPYTSSVEVNTPPFSTATAAVGTCSKCAGQSEWISVPSGSGFEWQLIGPDSCLNCSPAAPVTTPTSAGQFTVTLCQ